MTATNYNTEDLKAGEWRTYQGVLVAGSYYRGQILKEEGGEWSAATPSAAGHYGVYLGPSAFEGDKVTLTVKTTDAIVVYGDVAYNGIVDATGKKLKLTETQIGFLKDSNIYIRK